MLFRTDDVTRYPQAILDASRVLPGLEALTGADLLISPLKEPNVKSVCEPLSIPTKLGIEKHIKQGLLVQVKLGGDFINSIPNLDQILARMLHWSKRPWLLIVADLKVDREGQCILDGRATNWTWQAIDGALCYWQLRGGMYTVLGREGLFVNWVNGWLTRLGKLEQEKIHSFTRPVSQFLISTPAAVSTLATFDHIGTDKAQVILDACGTLADSLSYLSHPSIKIPGIGSKTIELARLRLGLRDDEILLKMIKEETQE